jgi:hypothetical protein
MQNDYIRPYKNFRVITIAGLGDVTELAEGRVRGIKLESSAAKANVSIADESGQSVTIEGLQSNIIHAISTTQIFETGTTATKVTVFW